VLNEEQGRRALAYIVRGGLYTGTLLQVLEKSHFSDEFQQSVLEEMKVLHKKAGRSPNADELVSWMKSAWRPSDKPDKYSMLLLEAWEEKLPGLYEVPTTEATFYELRQELYKMLSTHALTTSLTQDAEDIPKSLQKTFNAVTALKNPSRFANDPVVDVCSEEYVEQVMVKAGQDEERIPDAITGFHDIDVATGGMSNGELGLIIAGTSVGKSQLMVNIAYNNVLLGKSVLLIDVENQKDLMTHRIWSRISQIPVQDIDKKKSAKREASRLVRLWSEGVKGCICYKNVPRRTYTVPQLEQLINEVLEQRHIDFVLFDNANEIAGTQTYQQDHQRELEVYSSLATLMGTLHLPGLATAQFGREEVKRMSGAQYKDNTRYKPSMTGVQGSWQSTQPMTLVMGLWEPEVVDQGTKYLQAVVLKNRKGENGIEVNFRTEFEKASMYEITPAEFQSAQAKATEGVGYSGNRNQKPIPSIVSSSTIDFAGLGIDLNEMSAKLLPAGSYKPIVVPQGVERVGGRKNGKTSHAKKGYRDE